MDIIQTSTEAYAAFKAAVTDALSPRLTGRELEHAVMFGRGLGGGPVARVPKGTYERCCTPWEPDPDHPGRVRSFHYTKGWRYRRA